MILKTHISLDIYLTNIASIYLSNILHNYDNYDLCFQLINSSFLQSLNNITNQKRKRVEHKQLATIMYQVS